MNARTSQSHPLQIETLGAVGQGRLGLTFCPGKYDPHAQTGAWDRDVDTDLRALTDWGASTVVTLMETLELELLRVPDLGERVSRAGLRWWHLPIVDGGVPDVRFEHAWNRAGDDLRRRLAAGEGIVVHCRGGLGGLRIVAARLLVKFWESARDSDVSGVLCTDGEEPVSGGARSRPVGGPGLLLNERCPDGDPIT